MKFVGILLISILLCSFATARYIAPYDTKDLNTPGYQTGQTTASTPTSYGKTPTTPLNSINWVFPSQHNINFLTDGNITLSINKTTSEITFGLNTDLNLSSSDVNNANYLDSFDSTYFLNYNNLTNKPIFLDTNANTECAGASTFLSGEGICIDTNNFYARQFFDANFVSIGVSGNTFLSNVNVAKDLNVLGGMDWNGGNVWFVPITAKIQDYVDKANAGDTLQLGSGTYNITSTITINKQLNIIGYGNSGLVTTPISPKHGTLIKSATNNLVAFQIDSSNVRLASLSINLTGATSTGIATANNLTGIVMTNIDVILNGTGLQQGFLVYGSNAVLRDLTFNVTSTTGSASGLYVYNTATTTSNVIVDCFSVTGTTVGAAGDNWSFLAENQTNVKTVTLNLSNSVCKALAGTPADIAIAAISSGGTNAAIVNAYMSTFDGQDYDAYQDGTNQLNLGGSVIVNNKVFGTITYRATMTAGYGLFGNDLNVTRDLNVGGNDSNIFTLGVNELFAKNLRVSGLTLGTDSNFTNIGISGNAFLKNVNVAKDLNAQKVRAQADSNFTNVGVSQNTFLYDTIIKNYLYCDNCTAIGVDSIALGNNTTASNTYDTAFGQNTIASGGWSTAMGEDSVASGEVSTAIGEYAIASGHASLAFGSVTQAIGNYSIAMGYNTIASGTGSFATGIVLGSDGHIEASGLGSFVWGVDYGDFLPPSILAVGDGSMAGGYRNSGHIESNGQGSIAMGYSDVNLFAGGLGSVALGKDVRAMGTGSVAMGSAGGTNAITSNGSGSIAVGLAGVSIESTSAGAILSSGTGSIAMGSATSDIIKASSAGNIAMGSADMGSIQSTGGGGSIAMGSAYLGAILSSGNGSIAMGYSQDSNIISTGDGSVSMGYITKAAGNGSVALGYDANAFGATATSIGYDTNANADYATAIGWKTINTNTKSVALGLDVNVMQDLNVMRDVNIVRNLKVNGNLTISGTTLGIDSNFTNIGISGKAFLKNVNVASDLNVQGNGIFLGTLGAGAITGTSLKSTGLTATRVPYITTGGLLTDNIGFWFNGTTVTVPRLTTDGAAIDFSNDWEIYGTSDDDMLHFFNDVQGTGYNSFMFDGGNVLADDYLYNSNVFTPETTAIAEILKQKDIADENGEIVHTDYSPQILYNGGISVSAMNDLLKKGIIELYTENQLLKTELCKKDFTYSWCK